MSSRDTSHVDPKSVPALGHAFRNMDLIGGKSSKYDLEKWVGPRKGEPAKTVNTWQLRRFRGGSAREKKRKRLLRRGLDVANELAGVFSREDWRKLGRVHPMLPGRGIVSKGRFFFGDPFRRIRADEDMREKRVDALSLRRLPLATMRIEVFADRGDDQFRAVGQCLDAAQVLKVDQHLKESTPEAELPHHVTHQEVKGYYTPLIAKWKQRADDEMEALCRAFMHCCCSVGDRPTGRHAGRLDQSSSAERLARRVREEAQTPRAVRVQRERLRRRVLSGFMDLHTTEDPYFILAQWLDPKVALGVHWFELGDPYEPAINDPIDPKIKLNRELSRCLMRAFVDGWRGGACKGLLVKCTQETFVDLGTRVKLGIDLRANMDLRSSSGPDKHQWIVHVLNCLRRLLFGA
ncbi:MAG: hypothetical protein CMQ41_12000, partial [Gammaproteobacteria bacterium]|nr:hypothetical protein [Gammaproteobacteria bacterium]